MNDRPREMRSVESMSDPGPLFRIRISIRTILWMIAIIALTISLFQPGKRPFHQAANRIQCNNNLRQIAFALQSYQETYDSLPPAYVAADDGTPMHSWRVLILPFLDQQQLYDQYRFDEPWDGPNNRKLAERIPSAFQCPNYAFGRWGRSNAKHENKTLTAYVVLSGENTPFPGSHTLKPEEIRDGLSDTLLVVELDNESGVPWTSPQDIDPEGFCRILNDKNPRKKQHPGGVNAAFADGNVRFLKNSIDPNFVMKISTASGGEFFDWANAPW